MVDTTAEGVVDVLEVIVASILLLGYAYTVVVREQRIHDPILEGLVVAAGLVMFGDQYQEHFG